MLDRESLSMHEPSTVGQSRLRAMAAAGFVLVSAACLAACVKPEPRRFEEFMDDSIAREGTLARCNQQRQETTQDIECANARRAASALALIEERQRREALELESERKLAALRSEIERRDRAKREAMAAALAAAEAAYEAQWASAAELDESAAGESGQAAAVQFGAPISTPLSEQVDPAQIDTLLETLDSENAATPAIPRPFQ